MRSAAEEVASGIIAKWSAAFRKLDAGAGVALFEKCVLPRVEVFAVSWSGWRCRLFQRAAMEFADGSVQGCDDCAA